MIAKKFVRGKFAYALLIFWMSTAFSQAFGQACTTPPAPGSLCFYDQTAPNIIGDSNLNGQPDDGPRSFTIAARVCNFTGAAVSDVLVNVGDGATPGNFPIATVPVGAPYLDESYRLQLMSPVDATRFDGTLSLADGACVPFYFPVYYSVVDSNGDALWGKSNTPDDDLPLNFSIWGTVKDGGGTTQPIAPLADTVTIRNEITANPNKVQPNPSGETWYSLQYPSTAATRAAGIPWDPDGANTPPAGAAQLVGVPPTVAPGETITVYFRNPTFGNPNQGFDVAPPPGPDTDLWFQPIGERYWNPDAFRLVKVQSFLRGTGCNAAGEPAGERFYYIDDVEGASYMINAGPFETAPAFLLGMEHMQNQTWYTSELQLHSCNAWDAEWYGYTFMAINQGQSRISPYQEVASGSENEKYNGDYCGDLFGTSVGDADYTTPHLTCVPLVSAGTPDLELVKTVDKTADAAGGILTYNINATNIGTVSVGTPTSGIQIVDAIPADTTYVAASANCTLACVVSFSTDGGTTWSSFEPPAASVTTLRWAFNTALAPAAVANAGFQVQIDNPYGPGSGTVTNLAQLRIDNGPFLLQDDATTTVNVGQVRVHLFLDLNNNSTQDGGEPNLPGVDVQVTDSGAGIQVVTSDANGDVLADVPVGATNLDVVLATVPPGYVITTPGPTPQAPPGNQNQVVVAVANATVSGTNIGYFQPPPQGQIGDFVWEDLNANGLQDDGATGIQGVTIRLVSTGPTCPGPAGCPTVTDVNGNYSFPNLPADTYLVYVDETSIPGFPAPVRTTPNNPIQIVLGPDEVNDTADFGYETPVGGVIGDRVWADQNDNGLQDPGEPGLSGVSVELQDGVCTPGVSCPTTVTGLGGVYLFKDLAPGTYSVVIPTPPGTPSTILPNLPAMPYALAQSEANLDFDFGFVVPNANIGDFVWNDLDGDGIQDGGAEIGIPNVIVELLFVEDTTFSFPPACTSGLDCPDCVPSAAPLTLADLPTTLPACPALATDGAGAYLFDNGGGGLPPRSYRVKIHETTLPPGMLLTTPDSVTVPLSGSDFLTADFGALAPSATLGNLVWLDLNGNGIQDGGAEVGIDGVTVELLDNGGSVVQTTATAGGGFYSFTVLAAGNYSVRVTLPAGYSFSSQDQGGDDTVDSDVNTGTGETAQFAVAVPSVDDTRDVGLVPLPPVIGVAKRVTGVSLVNATTIDVTYALVVENLGPVALQNVQVTDDLSATFPAPVTFAVQAGPVAAGDVTENAAYDGSGDQNLLNAAASTLAVGATANIALTVRITPNGQTGTFNNTATASGEDIFGTLTTDISDDGVDPDPNGNGNPDEVGENDPTPVVLQTLTTHVYEDTNGNGVQDGGEPDLVGVTVNVTDSLAVMQAAVTNATGDVTFYVAAGVASRDVDDTTLPAGYTLTTSNDPDSPNVPVGGTIGANVGYQPLVPGSVGDFVWDDTDGDGIQDVGEPGIAGVVVELLDTGGTPVNNTTTSAVGAYTFSGVVPANYSVRFTAPAGFGFTLQNQGGDDNLDSDADPTTGTTALFPVTAGAAITNVDAGLVATPGIIGVAKQVTGVSLAGNGLVDVAYSIVVENLGTVALSNVNVTDNLAATFPAPVTFNVQVLPAAGGTLSANALFNGVGDTSLLNPAASSLAVGASATITFTVRIDPNGQTGPFNNTAIASGEDPGGTPVNDLSDDGVDPDPNGSGDPTEAGENDPTPVLVAIVTTHVYEDGNGNAVQDVGEPDLPSIDVLITGVLPTPTTNVTGDISEPVLAGAVSCDVVEATLPAGYTLTTANEPHAIVAVAGAVTPCGPFGYRPPGNPVIGLAKTVDSVSEVSAGVYDVVFTFVVENLGDVDLSNVQVTDDLSTTFPAPTTFVIQAAPAAGVGLTPNPAFDGIGDQNLLNAAASSLAVGASGTITFTVRLTANSAPGPFFNVGIAGGTSPSASTVSDSSISGSDPDPNGDGDPGENTPTVIPLPSTHIPATPVPGLSAWGFVMIALMLAGFAAGRIRRI